MKETVNIKDVLDGFILSQGFLGVDLAINENSKQYDKKDCQFVYVTNSNHEQSDLESISCTVIDGKVEMEITFYGTNNKLYQFLKNYNGGRSFLSKSFKNVEQFQRFFQIMQTQSAKSLLYKVC